MKLRTKLILAFLAMLIPALVVGAIAIAGHGPIRQQIERIEKSAGEMETVHRLQLAVSTLPAAPNDYLSTGDPAEQENYRRQLAQVEAILAEVEARPLLSGEERAWLAEARRQVAAIDQRGRAILALVEPVGDAGGIALMRQMDALAHDLATTTLADWHARDTAKLAAARQTARSSQQQAILWLVLSMAATLLVAVLLGALLAGRIIRPLRQLEIGAQSMAGGQFDQRLPVHTGDEIGHLAQTFNRMAVRLGDFYAELEQRVAERTAEMAVSEARYRTLAQTATDAIISMGADQRVRLFNRAAEGIFGYSAAEMIGQDIATLIPQEYRDRHAEGIDRYLRTRQPKIMGRTVELKGLRKGGEIFPLELSLSETHLEGEITFIGIIRDISQRVRAENEIRRRAAHLEALNAIIAAAANATNLSELLETALDRSLDALGLEMGAIWVADQHVERNLPADTALLATQTAQAAGLVDSPFPGMAVTDWEQLAILPPLPPDADRRLSSFIPLAAGWGIRASLLVPILAGEHYVGGLSLNAPHPRLWTEEEIALAEAVGQQLGASVQRLRLLARVQTQAQQIQQIMDTTPDGMLLLDAAGRIVLANPAAVEHLARLADAGVGDVLSRLGEHPLEELLSPPPPPPGGSPWAGGGYEVIVEGPPRQIFEIAAYPLDTGSQAEGWVLVLRDVSKERERQAHLQTQQQLATVGQLAAGIAHDFNNIMAVIVLYSQMLGNDPDLSERNHQRLATMQDQAKHATRLIRQLLDFSRRSSMERRPMDLLPFVKEMVKMLQRTLPENIDLVLNYERSEYLVDADPTCLQQILMNLAINARDAMPAGGALRITLSRLALAAGQHPPLPGMAAGDWVCMAVADNGSGIPPQALPHIFEPFFTTKEVGQGSGLGLAQVYGLVKQHGGEIGVTSPVNQGATFSIYLPLLAESEPVLSEPETSAPATTGNETILIVEDNPTARQAIVEALAQLGYQTLTAGNGEEALALFAGRRDTIDLVISDMVMPKMGGLDLYRALDAQSPGVKMIIASGYPLKNEDRALGEEGIAGWLEKPFTVDALAVALRRALEQ